MADKKISELTQLTGSEIDNLDELAIVDKSQGTGTTKKVTIGDLVNYTNNAVVGGVAGTQNRLAKFTGASTIGNSQITDDGTSIGIGVGSIPAEAKLHVAGNTLISSLSGSETQMVVAAANGLLETHAMPMFLADFDLNNTGVIDEADHAVEADHAATATSATTAQSAITAQSADNATTANTANSALTAGAITGTPGPDHYYGTDATSVKGFHPLPEIPEIVDFANTLFVDPNGKDSTGDGSQINPFRTINQALSKSSDGDVILVMAGTYNENLIISTDISLIGIGKNRVTIKSTADANIITIAAATNAVIRNMTLISNSSHAGYAALAVTGGSNNTLEATDLRLGVVNFVSSQPLLVDGASQFTGKNIETMGGSSRIQNTNNVFLENCQFVTMNSNPALHVISCGVIGNWPFKIRYCRFEGEGETFNTALKVENAEIHIDTCLISNTYGNGLEIVDGAGSSEVFANNIVFNTSGANSLDFSLGTASTMHLGLGLYNDDPAKTSFNDGQVIFRSITENAREIKSYSEKTTPVAGDVIIIEDSENGYTKKKVLLNSISGAGGNGSTGLPSTWEADTSAIKAIASYDNGNDVGSYADGTIYEFDSGSSADGEPNYLRPNDILAGNPGRWVMRKTFIIEGDPRLADNRFPSNDADLVHMAGSETISGEKTFTANATMRARFLEKQGADVASAAGIVLGGDGNCWKITGTSAINTISKFKWHQGALARINFTTALTISHNHASASGDNCAIMLQSAENLATIAGDILMLELRADNKWYEINNLSSNRISKQRDVALAGLQDGDMLMSGIQREFFIPSNVQLIST